MWASPVSNIPIAYPGESMFGPSPYNSATTGAGTLVTAIFQVARLCHSLTTHIQSNLAGSIAVQVSSSVNEPARLAGFQSHSDTHNNLFACRHIFCYSLMRCTPRSKPGHKPTHNLRMYGWLHPKCLICPLLLWYTLFFSTNSKIFYFTFDISIVMM